ncbi:hypothetical protein [Amycolatopsis jejuensis]|uniref:hypothetical protein n=1 Tax=Amycolatopsis jejuensis TaxID=330084 RepID=UPI000525E6AA|nr:hypothetical protein [Amycolatopsis jejuensis]
MRKTRLAIAGAGLALAVLTGCSSGDGGSKVPSISTPNASSAPAQAGGGKSDPVADKDAMRKFAKCMREHGVDYPDPDDKNGMAVTLEDAEKQKPALDACSKLLPNGGAPKKLSPEELDKQRKQAQCMREHGVDYPDPDPSGGALPAMPMDDAKATDAMKACGLGMGSTGQ